MHQKYQFPAEFSQFHLSLAWPDPCISARRDLLQGSGYARLVSPTGIDRMGYYLGPVVEIL